MFERFYTFTYTVSYIVRPNKKAQGSECVLNMTTAAPLTNPEEQLKVIRVLCKLHRVNPNAIELNAFTESSRQLNLKKWISNKFVNLTKSFRRVLGKKG